MTPTRSICMVACTLRPACSSFLAGPQPLWPQLLAEGVPPRPSWLPQAQQDLQPPVQIQHLFEGPSWGFLTVPGTWVRIPSLL